jgi:FAD-linked oxidoreductase
LVARLKTANFWTNWGETQVCSPQRIETPSSEDEILSILDDAERSAMTVKVAGAGHSFTDIACTDGILIRLDNYDRILEIDEASKQVTVQAGISLAHLNDRLAAAGLALPNLGDIAYQSVAGAISTATHGTGLQLGNLATQVAGFTLVTANGEVIRCSPEDNQPIFSCGRVGLGALGILSTVTLQCVPAFTLAALNRPGRLDAVLERLDDHVASNDHFEFFWFPHTDGVYTKANNRTDDPPRPRGRTKAYIDDILLENRVFGLICRLGRRRTSWIPRLNGVVMRLASPSRRVDSSYRIFASPRLVRFAEMEYGIPRSDAADALRALRSFIDSSGLRVNFPVEVRFVAGDDISLSPSFGRDTCYIAVHTFHRMPYEDYFRGVERVMDGFGGRPHWGKLHFQSAGTLRPRYSRWDDFADVRSALDPKGRFRNSYLDRVLG